MELSQVKIGERCCVVAVNLPHAQKARLSSLGIKEGATCEVLAYSLFKSGILISLQGVRVGLRREIAKNIEVVQ